MYVAFSDLKVIVTCGTSGKAQDTHKAGRAYSLKGARRSLSPVSPAPIERRICRSMHDMKSVSKDEFF